MIPAFGVLWFAGVLLVGSYSGDSEPSGFWLTTSGAIAYVAAQLLGGSLDMPKPIRRRWRELEAEYEVIDEPWPSYRALARGAGVLGDLEVDFTVSVDSFGIGLHIGNRYPPNRIFVYWPRIEFVEQTNSRNGAEYRAVKLKGASGIRLVLPWASSFDAFVDEPDGFASSGQSKWRGANVEGDLTEQDGRIFARFQEAEDSIHADDYQGALFQLRKLVREGEYDALRFVAYIYECGGNGVERDLTKAQACYTQLLDELDYSGTQMQVRIDMAVARINISPDYPDADFRLARQLFSDLSDSQPGAAYALGKMHRKGLGCPVDIDVAMTKFEQAWGKGHILAGRELAFCLFRKHRYLRGLKLWLTVVRRMMHQLAEDPESGLLRIDVV